jgi:hypothetical protein
MIKPVKKRKATSLALPPKKSKNAPKQSLTRRATERVPATFPKSPAPPILEGNKKDDDEFPASSILEGNEKDNDAVPRTGYINRDNVIDLTESSTDDLSEFFESSQRLCDKSPDAWIHLSTEQFKSIRDGYLASHSTVITKAKV